MRLYLLVPCLFVDPLGVDMRPWTGECPQEAFFPLLATGSITSKTVLFLKIPDTLEAILARITNPGRV